MPCMLDLFCGAGGASAGYARAGWDVIGVDLYPQPNYPYKFIQADALEYPLDGVDAIHASPPCQGYSRMSGCRDGLAALYPRLIEPIRARLIATGLPYVIENVEGAPLIDPITLCGWMFARQVYRHRLFESNMPITAPGHLPHVVRASKAGHWEPGTFISVAGHCAPMAQARKVMDIDWMTRSELAESIPPYFTAHIGRQLLEYVS